MRSLKGGAEAEGGEAKVWRQLQCNSSWRGRNGMQAIKAAAVGLLCTAGRGARPLWLPMAASAVWGVGAGNGTVPDSTYYILPCLTCVACCARGEDNWWVGAHST